MSTMLLPRAELGLSSDADIVLRVIITILHVFAASSSIFRFFYRKSTGRLWFDDCICLFAGAVDCFFFALLWMSAAGNHSPINTVHAKRVRYWLINVSAIVVVWADNTSFAFSLARVFRYEKQMRRTCTYLGIFFVFLCISIIIHVSVLCHSESKWMLAPDGRVRCIQSDAYRIYFTMLYIMADSILIAIPAYTLWWCDPPRNQMRLLRSGVCAAILGLALDILYVVFLFAPPQWEPTATLMRIRSSHLAAALSLLSSNVFFFTVLYYRHFQNENIEAAEESSTVTLTDVEIESSLFELGTVDSRNSSVKPPTVRSATSIDH